MHACIHPYTLTHNARVSSGDPINVSVDTRQITHKLNPLHLGCHSDSGFAHTERGFYSQMIFGEMWPPPVHSSLSHACGSCIEPLLVWSCRGGPWTLASNVQRVSVPRATFGQQWCMVGWPKFATFSVPCSLQLSELWSPSSMSLVSWSSSHQPINDDQPSVGPQ